VLALARQALEEGVRRGLTVVGPSSGQAVSGIVTFDSAHRDLAQAHARLTQAGIVTSLRRRRDGRYCLRLSAHFYNRSEEISEALKRVV